MHRWLINRRNFMTQLIEGIPIPDDTPVQGGKLCGTLSTACTMKWADGYNQSVKVHVDKSAVLDLMELQERDFQEANVSIVPLMNDGSEGTNRTNGVFGGWFNVDGEPFDWYQGHVYIEVFGDLWNWECGVHQGNCFDDEHTVVMQIQYPHAGIMLKVNVQVEFRIE